MQVILNNLQFIFDFVNFFGSQESQIFEINLRK